MACSFLFTGAVPTSVSLCWFRVFEGRFQGSTRLLAPGNSPDAENVLYVASALNSPSALRGWVLEGATQEGMRIRVQH